MDRAQARIHQSARTSRTNTPAGDSRRRHPRCRTPHGARASRHRRARAVRHVEHADASVSTSSSGLMNSVVMPNTASISGTGVEDFEERTGVSRQPQVVRITEGDEVAAGVLEPDVPRHRAASVLLADDDGAIGIRRRDRVHAVGRPVVDDDQLVVRGGVGQHALDRFLDVLRPVVDRHEHADDGPTGRAHDPSSQSAPTTTGAARATPPGARSMVGPMTSSSATGRTARGHDPRDRGPPPTTRTGHGAAGARRCDTGRRSPRSAARSRAPRRRSGWAPPP